MSEALEERISIDEVAGLVWLLPARGDNPEKSPRCRYCSRPLSFIVVEDTYAALAAVRNSDGCPDGRHGILQRGERTLRFGRAGARAARQCLRQR